MKGGEREHPDAEHRGLLVLKSIGYIIFLEEQTTTLQERRGKSQNFTTSCSFTLRSWPGGFQFNAGIRDSVT